MKTKRRKSHFKVAVIGAGAIGQDHVSSFKLHPDVEVVAVADVSAERGRETAERFGIPEVFTDYKKLLARTDIDVVSIGVPNYLHATVALDALKAGKNVMLDKPMATNAKDAARLEAEARKRGLLFMVGQNFRFNGDTQTAKQVVGTPASWARSTTRRRRGAAAPGSRGSDPGSPRSASPAAAAPTTSASTRSTAAFI
jgi:predicted dehydrogenase